MAGNNATFPGPIIQPASPNTNNRIDSAIAQTLVELITGDLTPAEAVAHIQYLCTVSAPEHCGPMSDTVAKVLGVA